MRASGGQEFVIRPAKREVDTCKDQDRDKQNQCSNDLYRRISFRCKRVGGVRLEVEPIYDLATIVALSRQK